KMQFDWNIDPEMIRLFDVWSIRYYSLLFVTGLFLGLYVVKKLWLKDHWELEELDKLTIWVFIATIVGARLGHCLFYEPDYYLSRPLEIFLPFKIEGGEFEFTGFQGLASHGGILAVFLAIWIFSIRSKKNIYSILDKVAVGGALTAVFIRLGNFMNSEIIGKATNADYGVVFRRVDNVLRHPSQLYEAFAYLLIFVILIAIYKNKEKHQEGFVFGLFFTLLFIARFLIEYTKINQVAFEEGMVINMGQILSIPFMLFGIIIMVLKFRPAQNNVVET
ncbi:MAG: prolipoprotein diacylglyceryl transferase, partial [Bacteroidota bacterium]